jgi:hypothetical protein
METTTVEIIKYVDLAQFKLVTIITPEPGSAFPIRVYSVPRDNMVQANDVLYRRNPETQTSDFFRVVSADTLPYPRPTCGTVCAPLPYQLFVRRIRISHQDTIDHYNEELETVLSLPF